MLVGYSKGSDVRATPNPFRVRVIRRRLLDPGKLHK
jgi:hypothetical protein